MTARNIILQCTNIHKHFALDPKTQMRLHVLKGIDLSIEEGEVISIVGASGSGKSTLLHILGGLDRPTEGEVLWKGQNILTLGDDALSKVRGSTVGFVFQFHQLLPEFTAMENVMIPMMIHGRAIGEAEQRSKELLGRVGLAERLDGQVDDVGGGRLSRL